MTDRNHGRRSLDDFRPNFVSSTAKIDRTLVWARIPDLNIVYCDESFLLAAGHSSGTPVKVDMNTLNVERGKLSRFVVNRFKPT